MYIKVSPFMFADKIKVPVLLIHGEADNNSGTFPMQSDRMYGAIKGNAIRNPAGRSPRLLSARID
jgi:dipeptidyl aminopeptidase/acylaminoacyl peptidase